MTFSEKLQALRKQHNMSQEQLAEQMNVTRQAISKWEQGESTPDIDNLVRLSKVFNVTIDYLIKDEPEPNQETPATEPETDHKNNIKRLEKIVSPIATIIFLGLGFFLNLWHPGWIVFVFAAAIKKFLKYSRTGKLNIGLDDISTILFLTIGLLFNQWVLAIFIIIALDIVADEILPKKKKDKKKEPTQ